MAELKLKKGDRIKRNGRAAKVVKVWYNLTALLVYDDEPKHKYSVDYIRLELEYEAGLLEIVK